jgi:hypothetical protein
MAGLIAFVLGALLLWQAWRRQQKVKASMSWPYVLGKVLAASVRQVVVRGDADTRDTTNYVPSVQYEYQVGGQNYQGNRLAFQEKGYNSHKKAFKLVADFPVGGPVSVYFDPANPQNAVLERKAHGNNFILAVGGILVLAAISSLFVKK